MAECRILRTRLRSLGVAVAVTAALIALAAYAGHELPFYPSYYPQEIRIEAVDPASAGSLLSQAEIHAYVGSAPIFTEAPAEFIDQVESLGSYIVLTLNPESPLVVRHTQCAIAKAMARTLAQENDGLVFHPYPITPLHADYLHHFDLAATAIERYRDNDIDMSQAMTSALRVKTTGMLASKLVQGHWKEAVSDWDAAVEQVDMRGLQTSSSFSVNGWLGPPWIKQGWFHAYLLLVDKLRDAAIKQRADSYVQRLKVSEYTDLIEKVNLERELLLSLTSSCERVVVGYTVKREFFNTEYSAGIENIAYDSLTGLNSPIFLRTVKLKDFPWNGWLRLGINASPSAAWNPIAGFTDETGRLIWSAVSDPALFPTPYGAAWELNRIADVKSSPAK